MASKPNDTEPSKSQQPQSTSQTTPKTKPPKAVLAPALAAPYDMVNDLYKLITNNKPTLDSVNTVYDELMAKEKAVLDTIRRVVEDKAEERRISKSFLDTPIKNVPLELTRSMSDLLADWILRPPSSYKDVIAILSKNHRMIYFGISLVVVALFLIFIQINDGSSIA